MPELIDWRQVAVPNECARQIVQTVAAGGLAALPSEAGTVLVADPDRLADPARPPGVPEGLPVRRLDGFFESRDFFARSAPTPPERVLANRLWPGPLGWVDDELPFPAWVPSHSALAAVLGAGSGPLAVFELDEGRPVDPAGLGDSLNVLVMDGPARPGPVTFLRPNDRRWDVVRPGVLAESAIRFALARHIVFVCTGNTCRSPLAEGLFRQQLAERLGCTVDELPDRGFVVASAGIAAGGEAPATAESVAAARDLGVDLTAHRSRAATADLIARADDVIVMTRSHLLTVAGRFPVLGGALRLLCGADGDLDDPITGGADVYRACATTIRGHVDRLITELGLT